MQPPLALLPLGGKRKSSSSKPQSEECLKDLPVQLPLALPPPRGKRKSSSSRPQSEECLEDLPVQPPFALPWLQSVELPPPPGSRVRNVSRICKCNLPLECLPSEENGNPLHLHCGGKRKSSFSKPQSEECLKDLPAQPPLALPPLGGKRKSSSCRPQSEECLPVPAPCPRQPTALVLDLGHACHLL